MDRFAGLSSHEPWVSWRGNAGSRVDESTRADGRRATDYETRGDRSGVYPRIDGSTAERPDRTTSAGPIPSEARLLNAHAQSGRARSFLAACAAAHPIVRTSWLARGDGHHALLPMMPRPPAISISTGVARRCGERLQPSAWLDRAVTVVRSCHGRGTSIPAAAP
jgi:hypothetical protein